MSGVSEFLDGPELEADVLGSPLKAPGSRDARRLRYDYERGRGPIMGYICAHPSLVYIGYPYPTGLR